MEDPSGARRQGAMQQPIVVEEAEWQMTNLARGVIEGVRFSDQTKMRQTVVDCYVLDRTGRKTGRGLLYNVPLAFQKINAANGEAWSPETGDLVLIGFINSNLRDPVVLNCLAPPNNTIQAKVEQQPRSYRKRSGTSEEIDKDGNRTVHVAKDDTLTVVGDGTISVGGNVTILVEGQADITVTGPTTVTTPTATVHAETLVELDTPLVHATGNFAVDGGISCAGTFGTSGGKIQTPGDIESTGGDVSDSTRSMAEDRGIYNGHSHPGDSGGTTGAPNQAQ